VPEQPGHLARLRRADSDAKAARVLAALDTMAAVGDPPVIAVVARKAGVSRRFIYDHPELRAEAERRAAEIADRHAARAATSIRVTVASLRADLENAKARNHRLEGDLAALKRRLGELIGREILTEDLADANIETAHQTSARVTELEQTLFETQEVLARRTEELEAARQINRELMERLNRGRKN
jgi:chromosome segregation ATPase